ncbi:MAG: pantoate--beta-alanine ligase [Crocinitomicaceae bacterium]
MKQLTKIDEIQSYVNDKRNGGCSIGFVPTMGALHPGHLSLVAQSTHENAITIVSIFVNPTQFNNSEDLKKYPRTIEKDLEMLSETGCDVVFVPTVEEIYSKDFEPILVDLGLIGSTLEGHFRPGHFDGVVAVVQRLFSIVAPDNAYFGRKDFQQVAVIRRMVEALHSSVQIHEGSTIRETSGLAMSSRNLRLSEEEKNQATLIYKVLTEMQEKAKNQAPLDVNNWGKQAFNAGPLELEYLEIVHPKTFEILTTEWVAGATACVVAYCGEVRLLDNLEMIPR